MPGQIGLIDMQIGSDPGCAAIPQRLAQARVGGPRLNHGSQIPPVQAGPLRSNPQPRRSSRVDPRNRTGSVISQPPRGIAELRLPAGTNCWRNHAGCHRPSRDRGLGGGIRTDDSRRRAIGQPVGRSRPDDGLRRARGIDHAGWTLRSDGTSQIRWLCGRGNLRRADSRSRHQGGAGLTRSQRQGLSQHTVHGPRVVHRLRTDGLWLRLARHPGSRQTHRPLPSGGLLPRGGIVLPRPQTGLAPPRLKPEFLGVGGSGQGEIHNDEHDSDG
jgi:hypothetical protein